MAEEYIKKEDAIQSVMNHDILKSDWSRAWAEYMLEDAPSADVAPVVRCKDCKWRNWETNGCDRNPCVEPWFENDFCSYGERKDNE